jgi:putative oxidoreductase
MKNLRDYAPFLLRLAFGGQLIYYVWPNIFNYAKMQEFAAYLTTLHFPVPIVMAFIAAYIEFIGGILMIVGWQTRIAGVLLTLNFLIVVLVAHVLPGDTYANTRDSLHQLAVAVFLLLNGPGKPSVEKGV